MEPLPPVPPEELSLPSSSETERIVLGSCCLGTAYATEAVARLTTDDFYGQTNRRTFQCIKELVTAGITADYVTVFEKAVLAGWHLEISQTFLMGLTEGIPDLISLTAYIDILIEKSTLRRLIRIGMETQALALRGDFSSGEIVGKLTERLGGVVRDKQEGPRSLKVFVDTFEGGIGKLLDPSLADPGIPTRFTRIDELTGGFHESEIWLLGGYTASGKTSMLQNIITNIALSGKRVVFFSLEMPTRRIFERMICERAGISMTRFRAGGLPADDRKLIQEASNVVYDLPVLIDHRSGRKASDIAMAVKAIHQKTPVSLVCIDYIQLVRPAHRSSSGNERLTEITTDIQQLAKDTGIPFLIASQLNRESQKRGYQSKKEIVPQLSDFRDSGSIEQCANVAMIINRPQVDQVRGDSSSRADIHVLKNRDGAIGVVPLRFTGWKFSFANS
jgi:replicative DNA helicase